MISLLLAVAPLCVAGDGFLAQKQASTVSGLLAPGYQVLEQRDVDLDGDRRLERVVLVGRTRRDGATLAAGLAVVSLPSPVVLASAALPTNGAYEFALGDQHLDLDGDGKAELSVDEHVAGGGQSAAGRTWWRFAGGALTEVHHTTLTAEYDGRKETRTLKVQPGGVLVERLTVVLAGAKARTETTQVTLAWDAAAARFRVK